VLTSGYNRVNGPNGARVPAWSTEFVFVFDVSGGSPVQKQALPVSNTFSGISPGIRTVRPFTCRAAASTTHTSSYNVAHRSAGTGGVDTLTNSADRQKLIRFLLSIEARTTIIP
jgi:hypothetical protein